MSTSSMQTVTLCSLIQLQELFKAVRFRHSFSQTLKEKQNIIFKINLHDCKISEQLTITGFTDATLTFHSDKNEKIVFYTESNTLFQASSIERFKVLTPTKKYTNGTIENLNGVIDSTSFTALHIIGNKHLKTHNAFFNKNKKTTTK